MMEGQDDQINMIGTSVGVLKNISQQIGNELDEQAVWVFFFHSKFFYSSWKTGWDEASLLGHKMAEINGNFIDTRETNSTLTGNNRVNCSREDSMCLLETRKWA